MRVASKPVGFITKLAAAHYYRGRAQGQYFLRATPEVQNKYCQLSHSSWSGWFETWVGFYLVPIVTDSSYIMWCNKPIRDTKLCFWQKQNMKYIWWDINLSYVCLLIAYLMCVEYNKCAILHVSSYICFPKHMTLWKITLDMSIITVFHVMYLVFLIKAGII